MILALGIAALGCGRSGIDGSGATGTPTASPTDTVAPSPTPSATPTPTPAIVDADGDGLDDAYELQAATDYLPFLAIHPDDGCPLGGMVVRVRPHPMNPALLEIEYDHLYQNDCGAFGHVGDDEVFAETVDPAQSGAAGILAIKAISHQDTICERDTQCGSLPGMTACTTALVNGESRPVVFSSKDKHGSYAVLNTCQTNSCFDQCALPAASAQVPLVNAGEPDVHFTDDLTANGFITGANGWTESSLMHFDPWAPGDFGGAGDVSLDLTDPAFITPVP